MSEENNNETPPVNEPIDSEAGLKSKNAELHGIIKKLQNSITSLTEERDSAGEAAKRESMSELEKLTADLAKQTERASAAEKQHREAVANASIADALAANNVDKSHVPLLLKGLRQDITYDKAGVATIEGQAIPDYLKSYFDCEGKVYTRAPNNSGSGISGNDGSKPLTMTKDDWSNDKFLQLVADDPAEAKRCAVAAGKSHLVKGI